MAKDHVAVKGRWFGGDRTVQQQLMGLEYLWPEIQGKTVLDIGCAEGEISFECVRRGAKQALGIEMRADAVKAAAVGVPLGAAMFVLGDANTWTPAFDYDVVLMLAILHKLKDPSAACRRFARAAKELVVLRLVPAMPQPWVIMDARSGMKPHDVGTVLAEEGFELEKAGCTGPFGEWVGYYRRKA